MWTSFMDMHSGGGRKLDWEKIYIEAPIEEAKSIFYSRFGRNPERVTCSCCGEDYAIEESPDLLQATGYDRGCDYAYVLPDGAEKTDEDWHALELPERRELSKFGRYVERESRRRFSEPYVTLEEYTTRSDALFIYADNIKPEERTAIVPEQGYVWVD